MSIFGHIKRILFELYFIYIQRNKATFPNEIGIFYFLY